MAATLTVGDQVTNAGNISINSGNVNATNVFRFTLEAEETVRYTVTSTGDQAPVISWLAVVKASGTPMIAQTVEELTEVPEKLQDKYASLDEMKEAMLAEAGKALDGDVTGYDLYNIRITVSRDGGLTWTEADKNDLPAGGVEITFKYPEGSSATEDYQFAVAGIWDGEVGVNVGSSLVYGNDGITMKVLSEGPVAVTYLKKEETPTETDPTETETDPTETVSYTHLYRDWQAWFVTEDGYAMVCNITEYSAEGPVSMVDEEMIGRLLSCFVAVSYTHLI